MMYCLKTPWLPAEHKTLILKSEQDWPISLMHMQRVSISDLIFEISVKWRDTGDYELHWYMLVDGIHIIKTKIWTIAWIITSTHLTWELAALDVGEDYDSRIHWFTCLHWCHIVNEIWFNCILLVHSHGNRCTINTEKRYKYRQSISVITKF